jgi:hypothetical protein
MFKYTIIVITDTYYSYKQLQTVISSRSVVELKLKLVEIYIYSKEL